MDESKKTGPRDVLLYILSMIGLYVSVISFGSLVFRFINIYFPDPLLGSARFDAAALRWPLAVLVIVFPLYAWITTYLNREIARIPEKRELKTRKWLLYLTLFIAAIVIVGDLIALIFTYLNGDLTARFVLKVLTVLIIAAAVFLYYGWNIRKAEPASSDFRMRLFVRGASALVVLAVLFGFWQAGSPQKERMRRFDEQRVSHLQQIQWEIVSYWQAKQALPPSIEALRDDLRGFVPPRDPQTGEPYEYRALGALSFELCADFSAESREEAGTPKPGLMGELGGESWQHGEGRECFERTIDPDRFPPLAKTTPR